MRYDPLVIGHMVRFHRKQAGLSQLKLAELGEVGKTAVFDIEKGKATVQLATLLSVLHVLNIHLFFSSPLMTHFERDVHEKS